MAPDEIITSTKNPAVTAATRLHRSRHRRDTRRTLIEGPSVVAEALAGGAIVHEIYVLESDTAPVAWGGPTRWVSEAVLRTLAGTETPRGPVAVISIPAGAIPTSRPLLVAWGVSDPGNCGTLIRSAAAFGSGYVAGPGSADSWSPKVLRSAAGGHFHTSVGAIESIRELASIELIGTVAGGGGAPGPVSAGEALLIGSEAHGLPPAVVAACSRVVTIPMPGGTESLNAAVAGSIAAFLGTLPGRD
jgi:TrmH family RNA methyltransferase